MAIQTINGSLQIKKDENTVLVVEGITQQQKDAINNNTQKVTQVESGLATANEKITSVEGIANQNKADIASANQKITTNEQEIAQLKKLSAGTIVTARKDYSAPGYNPSEEAEEDKKMVEGIIYRLPFNKSDVFIPAKADDPENTVTDRNVAYVKFVALRDGTVDVMVEKFVIQMNYDKFAQLNIENTFEIAPKTTEVQDLNSLEGDKLVKASAAKAYVDTKVQEVQQGSANKAEIVFVDSKPDDMSQYTQNQIVIFPTA